ncbi:MAG: hypothetical protein P1P82_06180 [Bacteroidales bacterium]|nr:hypothetical protein [Bacteroidales bacterium]MDT8430464.1 hypothetical protein [Bacteroidales bacterium]
MMNRRAFFAAFARISILSVMAAMVGVFVYRDKVSVQSDCTLNKFCNDCGKLNNCTLPGALKAKGNGKG